MTKDEAKKLVDDAAAKLAEHFDGSVRIFVSWQSEESDGKSTCTYDGGRGNWYAAYGQVHGWLIHHDEAERQWTRSQEDKEDPAP